MMGEKRFVIGDENTVMLLKRMIMMSNERFEIDVDHLLRVWDTGSNKRLTVEEVVDLLNHFWDRILYEIKRSGDLHKTIDDLHIFLEDKGLVEEFIEWSKND